MEETNSSFFTKKNIITMLIIGITLLVIPVAVKLAEQQQLIKTRAAVDTITFSGKNVSADGKTTTSPTVDVELRSPLGPPISQAP